MSLQSEVIRILNNWLATAKKISDLPSATTPLSGTEELEINQGGVSKKVASAFLGGGGGAGVWGAITGTLSDQTDLQTALDLKESLYRAFRRETANTGLVLTDAIGGVEMNVAGANTVTVPLNATQAFPVGTLIPVVQYGAGLTSIVATGGVTINTSAGNLDSPGQYAPMFLRKIATNEWYLWNGTAGGGTTPNLQEVLDEGSTATIATDFSIVRTSEFGLSMTAAAGIVLGTTADPIQIGAGGAGAGAEILMLVDTLTRLQLGNHNDYHTNGGTAFHRFFCPGAGAQIRLMEESGSGTNYIALKAPTDVTTAQVYTFPAAGPSADGQALTSTTGGTLSWVAHPNGLPAVDTSGTAISFAVPQIYGTEGAPETGNITIVTTGLVKGMTQLLIHNNGSEPTYGSEIKIISGAYATGELNYIMLLAISTSRILVTISQEV